jgi:hypothetical protein
MAVIITRLVARRRTVQRSAIITPSDCQTLLSVATLRRHLVIKPISSTLRKEITSWEVFSLRSLLVSGRTIDKPCHWFQITREFSWCSGKLATVPQCVQSLLPFLFTRSSHFSINLVQDTVFASVPFHIVYLSGSNEPPVSLHFTRAKLATHP